MPLREINPLEFVLLINEENDDLYIPAWMGISSLWHPPEGKDGHLMSPYVTEENVGV